MSETTTTLPALTQAVDLRAVFHEQKYQAWVSTAAEALVSWVESEVNRERAKNDYESLLDEEQTKKVADDRKKLIRAQEDFDRISNLLDGGNLSEADTDRYRKEKKKLDYNIETLSQRLKKRDTAIRMVSDDLKDLMDLAGASVLEAGIRDFLVNHVEAGFVGPCSITFLGTEYSYSE
ncbi:hypothetical protein FUAX_00360 [Fulvitalea axinellae]|uniref:Uncharacterized protein n=1 Tax=Fulvitalea axinellae TaxID=1182444 RepID=A0AAU9C6J9_9BACT|nr:hypothetical protein FUAX_00360 [Fulvitalea axinellae]